MLSAYEALPALAPEVDEELSAFVAKRIEEGGVETDYREEFKNPHGNRLKNANFSYFY